MQYPVYIANTIINKLFENSEKTLSFQNVIYSSTKHGSPPTVAIQDPLTKKILNIETYPYIVEFLENISKTQEVEIICSIRNDKLFLKNFRILGFKKYDTPYAHSRIT